MLIRMLRQSWRHDTNRKLLAVVTVFLAASLISALLAISINIGNKMSMEMKSYGANIEISPEGQVKLPDILAKNVNKLEKEDLLAESELPNIMDIFWRNNIIGFAPFVRGQVKAPEFDKTVNIIGTFLIKTCLFLTMANTERVIKPSRRIGMSMVNYQMMKKLKPW
ncbi:hypothetical protein OGZ01_23190 [Vibrio harveyi]|nr:hypothetical protein [Vibrio harveyi]